MVVLSEASHMSSTTTAPLGSWNAGPRNTFVLS